MYSLKNKQTELKLENNCKFFVLKSERNMGMGEKYKFVFQQATALSPEQLERKKKL